MLGHSVAQNPREISRVKRKSTSWAPKQLFRLTARTTTTGQQAEKPGKGRRYGKLAVVKKSTIAKKVAKEGHFQQAQFHFMRHAHLLFLAFLAPLTASAFDVPRFPVGRTDVKYPGFISYQIGTTATIRKGRAARIVVASHSLSTAQRCHHGVMHAFMSTSPISDKGKPSRNPRLLCANHRHKGTIPQAQPKTSLEYSLSSGHNTEHDLSVRERILRLQAEMQHLTERESFEGAAKLR